MLADTPEAVAVATTPAVVVLMVAATLAEADSAVVAEAAVATVVVVAPAAEAELPQEEAPQQAAVVAEAVTTKPTQQLYDRCATGCGPGFGIGRPVSTRVCSRVTRILHPSGSTTPPHVLSRTPIHATWSGPIIHAVAFVL
jgi:hypothetical protein